MQPSIFAEKLFTGTDWVYNYELVVEGGLIKSMQASTEKTLVNKDAENFWVPAFIDFQVYGAGGKLLAVYPSADTLQTMYDVFSLQGTCLFQPTVATNSLTVFKACIDAVREYQNQGGKGVAGLHLEGPWINPEKRGAHISAFIHAPSVAEVKELLEYGKGIITTITIAPEVCSAEVMELLQSNDVILSAGHSNATYALATDSFSNGISTATHLYNAMSPLQHREPGLVGAAMLHPSVMASIIPDGHHVSFEAIAIAKKIMGDRLFAITDAVTETSEGDYRHQFVNGRFECNGTLSGSAISMHQAFYNLVKKVGIEVEEALKMCALFPAKALGVGHQHGRLAPGYAAQALLLNKQLEIVDIMNG